MIKGKKVFFRAMEEADLPLVQQWLNDPEISNLVGGWSFPVSLSHQKSWFARSSEDARNQRWIVESYDDGVIGLTGLWEIDWHNRHALTALKIGEGDFRGKGYGPDAIMTLMLYAFCQVGLNRLWGAIIEYNTASYRAYVEKCGWKVEGILRQQLFRHGRYFDELRVAILREEFMAHPLAGGYLATLPNSDTLSQITIRRDDIPSKVQVWLGKKS